MFRRFGKNIAVYAILLCGIAATSAFHFPDFNLFDVSSTTMDNACAVFHSMIESINFATPEMEHVLFQFRTPCNRIEYRVSDAEMIPHWPGYDVNQTTVVIVTGWNSDLDEPYTEHLTKAYLCRGDTNVIVVDTAHFIKTEYIKSAYNTEKLGKFVAIGLKNLKIPGKKIHLIGHSLGAHIMGSAGRHFAQLTGTEIARITGLDPARPCYRAPNPVFRRLTRDDATFVDIIHTNPHETGLEEPIGDIDFYPNGLNPEQPACSLLNIKCSHIMSIDYYTETVYHGNGMNFLASPCTNYTYLEALNCTSTPRVPMGFAVGDQSRGIYLLAVNAESPYGINAKNDFYLSESKECGVCTNETILED